MSPTKMTTATTPKTTSTTRPGVQLYSGSLDGSGAARIVRWRNSPQYGHVVVFRWETSGAGGGMVCREQTWESAPVFRIPDSWRSCQRLYHPPRDSFRRRDRQIRCRSFCLSLFFWSNLLLWRNRRSGYPELSDYPKIFTTIHGKRGRKTQSAFRWNNYTAIGGLIPAFLQEWRSVAPAWLRG
jgi:hypothetical protein